MVDPSPYPGSKNSRIRRQATDTPNETATEVPEAIQPDESNNSLGPKGFAAPVPTGPIKLMGLRVEESDKEPKIVDELIISVLRETNFLLRLFGTGFTNDTIIAYTHTPGEYGETCDHLLTGEYRVSPFSYI